MAEYSIPNAPTFYGNPTLAERVNVAIDAKNICSRLFQETPDHVVNVAILMLTMATSGTESDQEVKAALVEISRCVIESRATFRIWKNREAMN